MGGRNNVLLRTIALSTLSSKIKDLVAKIVRPTEIDCPQGTFNKHIEAQQWCLSSSYFPETEWSCWGQPEVTSLTEKGLFVLREELNWDVSKRLAIKNANTVTNGIQILWLKWYITTANPYQKCTS